MDKSKKYYRFITTNLSRQEELDADPKAIYQIEFIGQLKKLDDNYNATDPGNDESMLGLTILKKSKRRKYSQGSVKVLQITANYQEARVKLTSTRLNKLKSAAKNKTGTMLRLNKKNYQDEEWLHKLFLTTRQTIRQRHAFANNMSTDMKLSKAQISKKIQSCGSFGPSLDNFGQKGTKKCCYSFS